MDIRQRSLKHVFMTYLLSIIGSIIIIVSLVSLSMRLLMVVGAVLPANHDEKIAYRLKEQLEGIERLTAEDLEGRCQYALFDKTWQLIQTNIEDTSLLRSYIEGEKVYGHYDVTIESEENDAVVFYELAAKYNNPFLQAYFPSLELMYLLILIGGILIGIVLVSNSYGRKLKRALMPLEKAVDSIGQKDLDFQMEKSSIREFDDIGKSLQSMQVALQESLMLQWESEKKKREQMAALAHDIKTPLTIIKGSADLLEEEENLDAEQQALSRSIRKNSEKIQAYVQLLMEIAKEGTKEQLGKELVSIKAVMAKVTEQAEQLAKLKSISIKVEMVGADRQVVLDHELISRALMNIISNGIDYTPEGKSLSIKAVLTSDEVSICVEDEGIGFTPEALQKAGDPFYMGEESRSPHGHYGMGLYIAKQIVRRHQGSLTISNRTNGQGAEVKLTLPIR
ncbi:MAG: sensor histidine kinase [Cellulosilyticaceae bacterium]